MKKHIIWSNNIDVDDFRESYREFLEANNIDRDPDNEDALWEYAYETNDDYIIVERINLDVNLNRPIVVIASLGRWNGRFNAYKIIKSGNIKDCLYSSDDYIEWFVDGYDNFRAVGNHHDGTNYYLYRVFKENISSEQMNNFLDKIYEGTYTSADVSRYTNSVGKYISKVYGF